MQVEVKKRFWKLCASGTARPRFGADKTRALGRALAAVRRARRRVGVDGARGEAAEEGLLGELVLEVHDERVQGPRRVAALRVERVDDVLAGGLERREALGQGHEDRLEGRQVAWAGQG